MAPKRRTDPDGSARAVVTRWQHSLSGIRLVMLPIVLGCWSMLVYGAMEEMMIAPIEVIEEWGCYDTEIRLTCGNLESKIAILEARFTPRCMEERSENCVYMDEHSVAHPFASQKVDKLILEETEAGRRFLATLRRNHERELEAASDGPGTQELTAGEGVHRRQGATIVAARSLAKDKRSSLRTTLEHLIVRYLRRLTSDDDADGDDGDEPGGYEVAARYRRQSLPATDFADGGISTAPDTSSASPGFSNSMEITLLTNDTDTNLTDSWEDTRREDERWDEPPDSSLTAGTGALDPRASDAAEGYGSSGPLVAGLLAGTREGTGEVSVSEGRGASDSDDGGGGGGGDSEFRDNGDEVEYNLPIGGSVPTVNEADGQKMMGELRKQRKQHKTKQRGECDSVRKRVSQLDRFELERSMRNGSFREYNIRNALNYRCSGKNHCSFIFSQDHPFAVVWKEGTVRIKYICMDAFRFYCDGDFTCKIWNWNPREDGTFVLHHVPKTYGSLELHNLLLSAISSKLFEIFEATRRNNTASLTMKVSAVRNFVLEDGATLTSLEFDKTHLSTISFGVGCSLQNLTIIRSKLSQLPKTLRELKALNTFRLYHTPIQAVNLHVIAELPSLKSLDLTRNRIHSLYCTPGMVRAPVLATVHLAYNRLRSINMNLFQTMESLEAINLSHNLISVVSGSLVSSSLSLLDLSYNKLLEFDSCQWSLPNIYNLVMNDNLLQLLPRCLEQTFFNVSFIDMHNNRLRQDEMFRFGKLDNLQYLTLNHNQLTRVTLNKHTIPKKMSYLSLSNNKLTRFEMPYVPSNATFVDVTANCIVSIDWKKVSPNLTKLALDGNPMDCRLTEAAHTVTYNWCMENKRSKCDVNMLQR